jgi:hypothetical protein
VKIVLLDQCGRQLIEASFRQASVATIPTEALPDGVYFLRFSSGIHQQTYKVIKISGK